MNRTPVDGRERVERRRLGLFLCFAFGIAWLTAAILFVTGGLRNSRTIVSAGGVSLTLASVLLPTTYMFAPGVANVMTRWLTDEGWNDLALSFAPGDDWRAYVAAWLGPGVLTALGAAVFFLLFPRYFDPTAEAFASTVGQQSAAAGGAGDVGMAPLVLAAAVVGASLTINPLVNTVFAFGEEFGWRGYLLPKLLPLGVRRAVGVHGLIWGAWHWPLILMGYEYGFGYVGAPWTGLALFLVFTVATGTFLAWLTLRTGSVLPASLGHGAINATVVFALVFSQGNPNSLLGPLPLGLVGVLPWLALAAFLLSRLDADDRSVLGSPPGPATRDATDE